MQNAVSASMDPKDKATLRNLVLAILASTGAALVVGTFCLARVASPPERTVSSPAVAPAYPRPIADPVPPGISVRSSAGGVPVGTTQITAAELERDASASTLPSPEPVALPSPPVRTAPPAPIATVPPPASPGDAGSPTTMPRFAPDASAAPASASDGSSALPPAPDWGNLAYTVRGPTQGLEAGAGQFLSEPPPWAASAMTPNPEAGAGPFATETPTPR
jgi:hypothetical protein